MDELVSLAEDVLMGCDDPLAQELASAVIRFAESEAQSELEEDYEN